MEAIETAQGQCCYITTVHDEIPQGINLSSADVGIAAGCQKPPMKAEVGRNI